ncbi:MAG: NUDIX domain-containing protein [Bacilli bacterium]|nr:NUDIX domain-containing protein [Bacilli bacterium]
MEYLDIYDEEGNFLGKEERSIVHRDALWHKTIHCWLYDKNGNVFFQIRKEEGTLYTTASGHLQAGETLEEGFSREIKEEIGISVNASDALCIHIIPFVMDREKSDGTIFRDRAFAHIFVDLYEGDYQDFKFDANEVSGIVLVNAKETLKLFQNGTGSIAGTVLEEQNGHIISSRKEICFADFLVNAHETALEKYGAVLEKIIELTE